MKIIRCGLLLTIICSACGLASAQGKECRVIYYERDLKTNKQVSARIVVGGFDWQGDRPMTRVVQHQATGVFTAVRVERVAGSGGKSANEKIRLAISFVEKPDDGFNEVGPAEAEATYDENWLSLSVSKNIKVADRLYTYYLGCDRRSNKPLRIVP
jgi:hypothetical protein